MNGPVPTGFRENWSPSFCTAVGEMGPRGASAAMRRKGAYGCLNFTRSVEGSTTSEASYGPMNERATLGAPSGVWMRSKVNFIAAASNGVPSWNFTFRRRWKVYALPSGAISHFSARPGFTLPSFGSMTTSVSMNWMRILRVAARLVMCGSRVSMSCRAAKTSRPPAFAATVGRGTATPPSTVTRTSQGVISRNTRRAGMAASLLDHEHLVGGELRREQLGPCAADDRHILEVEKAGAGIEPVRLEGEHHALLQREVAAARHDRLLLVPPRPHAVPDQDGRVLPTQLGEYLDGEVVDATGGDTRAAVVDDLDVGVSIARVVVAESRARLAQDGHARLMPRIAVEIGDVVGADDVSPEEELVALPRVRDGVAMGVQNPVCPVRSPPDTAPDEAAVDGPLRLAVLDGLEHLGVGVVEQIRALPQERQLGGRLHPAHGVHHAVAIDQLGPRQSAPHLLPVLGAHIVLLEADPLPFEPGLLDHFAQPAIGRFVVGVVDGYPLHPRVAKGQLFRDGIEHDDGIAVARPQPQHSTRGVGDVHVARERPRIREAREVGEVLARARDHGREPLAVHELVQARDIDGVPASTPDPHEALRVARGSAAKVVRGVGHRASGRDEIGERNALVRRRPLFVDADVARTVLHGRNARLLKDIAVADVSEPPPAADDGLGSRGPPLALGERAHQRMVPRHFHRVLAPALRGARRRNGQLVVEGGVVLLDAVEEPDHVRADAGHRLPRHRADLKEQVAFAARHPRVVLLVVVFLVHGIERVGGETGQIRMRREGEPAARRDGIQAGTDAPDDL